MKLSRGILLGLITVLLILCFKISPESVELLYGQLFYPFYQFLRYFISAIIPIPLIYILALYLVGWLIYKWKRTPPLKKWSWLSTLRMTFSIIGMIVFFFYILWGFNYMRPTMEERLDIEFEKPDTNYIRATFSETIDSLNSLRSKIEAEDVCSMEFDTIIDPIALSTLKKYLSYIGYPSAYRGVIHELWPAGMLLRWSTAGFFLPFVGEGYIDSALPGIQKPFVSMHEMSHVYGVTQEGEANYLAFAACKTSPDARVRYSAYLGIYPYIASAARSVDTAMYADIHKRLDKEVMNDFQQIADCLNAYPDIFPDFRDFIYNSYLESQGVKGGIANYSKIIYLDYNWKRLREEKGFLRGIK